MSGAGSWAGWLRGSGYLGADVSLLVGGARDQGVPELELVLWWSEPGPEVSSYRAMGVPGLMLAHWWAGLVGRACGQGWFLTHQAVESRVSQNLCWSPDGFGQIPGWLA